MAPSTSAGFERRDGSTRDVRPGPAIVANGFNLVLQLVVDGAGISVLPRMLAQRAEGAGHVRPILEEWGMRQGGLHLVWPASRHLAPRVRAFVDHTASVAGRLDIGDFAQSFESARTLVHGDLEPPA